MDKKALNDIYRFWFGDNPSATEVDPERIKFWMIGNDENRPAGARQVWPPATGCSIHGMESLRPGSGGSDRNAELLGDPIAIRPAV